MVINRKLIGKEFEEKAYEFLKPKFDKVEWLSEINSTSTFDFKCIKGDKILWGDAKFKTAEVKPRLTFNQRKADFVVTNDGDKIILINKKDFDTKVQIESHKEKIGISAILKTVLDSNKDQGESYDDILWRLLWEAGWKVPRDKALYFYGKYVLGSGDKLTHKQILEMERLIQELKEDEGGQGYEVHL